MPNFSLCAANAELSVDFIHLFGTLKVPSIIRVTGFLKKSHEPFTPSLGPCKSPQARIITPPNLSLLGFRSLEMIYMGFTILLISAPMAL